MKEAINSPKISVAHLKFKNGRLIKDEIQRKTVMQNYILLNCQN
jgi:hypothetical protein